MTRHVVTFLAFILVGCASQQADFSGKPFHSRLYLGNYDEVWMAALRALADYPLKLSNKDSGRIQTEVINGPYNELMFTYPESIDVPERYRYSLQFALAKLEDSEKNKSVRVRVQKDLEHYKDFYSGWAPATADGLEEQVILYRIEHILRMNQFLKKQGFE